MPRGKHVRLTSPLVNGRVAKMKKAGAPTWILVRRMAWRSPLAVLIVAMGFLHRVPWITVIVAVPVLLPTRSLPYSSS